MIRLSMRVAMICRSQHCARKPTVRNGMLDLSPTCAAPSASHTVSLSIRTLSKTTEAEPKLGLE
jgi:hypothetical protein